MPDIDKRYSRPIPNAPLISRVGRPGLRRSGGYIREEQLRQLQDEPGRRVYYEMTNDPIVGSMVYLIQQLFRNLEWTTVAASDSAEDIAAKDFIDENFKRLHNGWANFLSEVPSTLVFGWSIFEIIYTREGGKLYWDAWEGRSQMTLHDWIFDEDADIPMAMVQHNTWTGFQATIPLRKCIHLRTTAERGNPEGRSVLRSAYKPWYYKTKLEEIEAIGAERDLAGLPVMTLPPEYMANDAPDSYKQVYELAKRIVRNVRNDEQAGLVLPAAFDEKGNPVMDFKLLASPGQRQFDIDKVIRRHEQRILMTMLADFIMLGHEKVGSFALSSDKTSMFIAALAGFLKQIAEDVRWQAFGRLLSLNGETGTAPLLEHSDFESQDIDRLGLFIERLTKMGYLTPEDDELAAFLRHEAGIPGKPMTNPEILEEPEPRGASNARASET